MLIELIVLVAAGFARGACGQPDIKSTDAATVLQPARNEAILGKAALQQARLVEDAATTEQFRTEASKHFDSAVKLFTDSEKRLPAVHDKTQARLEMAQTLLAQAGGYPGNATADKRARADLFLVARKTLESIVKEFAKDVQESNIYMAKAWLVLCCKETGDTIRFQNFYKELALETRPESATAMRWGQAFYIQAIRLDQPGLKLARKEAEDWLKNYAGFRDAPEGAIVRFQLAMVHAIEAQLISKDVHHPEAGKLYDQAQQEFAAVASLETDLAEKAEEYALNLRFLRIGGTTPLADLKDFEECYLRVRHERAQLQDLSVRLGQTRTDADRINLEAQRKMHAQACVAVCERALSLSDKSATPAHLSEVSYWLARCHMVTGDAAKAFDVSSKLGQAEPQTKYSAQAANYGLEVGAVLLARHDIPQTRQHLRGLATFVLKERATVWRNDPVLGRAHYELAMLAATERKYDEALHELEQLTPSFHEYFYARCQLAFLALAASQNAPTETARQQLVGKAAAVLKELPPLPPQLSTTAAGLYFTVQVASAKATLLTAADLVEVGQAQQAAELLTDLRDRVAAVRDQLDKIEPQPEDARQALAAALDQVKTFTMVGLARAESHLGNYDKVLKDIGPAIKELLDLVKDEKASLPIKRADSQAAGELLGVALRAHIQLSNPSEARRIMILLRRLTDDRGTQQVGSEVLTRLVDELKLQMRDQRKAGDKAALEGTIARFGVFLDALGKDDPKLVGDRAFMAFLATTYASLDKHPEAAKFFAKITLPKIDPKKKLTPQEQRELDDYWLLEATYARSLRLSKQRGEARRVLATILSEGRSAGRFQAEKELNHLLEDEGDYGKAITAWSEYLENPGIREVLTNPKSKAAELRAAQELYFDGYYHFIWCHFQFGQAHKVEAKRKEYVGKAASMILALELSKEHDGWELIGARLQELLAREPVLREAYMAAKGK
jgi:hypothetical protein